MNRNYITGLILALALAAAVWAANPVQLVTTYAMFFTGPSGEVRAVTAADPLPVTSSGGTSATVDSAGAQHIAPKGATSVSDSAWAVTSTPASWTMTASATDIALWNLGTITVWLSFNNSGATISSGIPLTASSTIARDAAQGMVVWAVASANQTLYRAEGRR